MARMGYTLAKPSPVSPPEQVGRSARLPTPDTYNANHSPPAHTSTTRERHSPWAQHAKSASVLLEFSTRNHACFVL